MLYIWQWLRSLQFFPSGVMCSSVLSALAWCRCLTQFFITLLYLKVASISTSFPFCAWNGANSVGGVSVCGKAFCSLVLRWILLILDPPACFSYSITLIPFSKLSAWILQSGNRTFPLKFGNGKSQLTQWKFFFPLCRNGAKQGCEEKKMGWSSTLHLQHACLRVG